MYVLNQFRVVALCALATLAALFWNPTRAANDAPSLLVAPPPSPAIQYVRDLLALDAAAALRAEADRAQTDSLGRPLVPGSAYAEPEFADTLLSTEDVQAGGSSSHGIRLKAILGVGTRLSALVDLNGHTLVYRAGRAAAVTGSDAGIRLVKIKTPCAEFLLPNGQPDIRCISEVGQ